MGCSGEKEIVGQEEPQGPRGISASDTKVIYSGFLDNSGNITITTPEITIADIPLAICYLYHDLGLAGLGWYISALCVNENEIKVVLNSTNYANIPYKIVIMK